MTAPASKHHHLVQVLARALHVRELASELARSFLGQHEPPDDAQHAQVRGRELGRLGHHGHSLLVPGLVGEHQEGLFSGLWQHGP